MATLKTVSSSLGMVMIVPVMGGPSHSSAVQDLDVGATVRGFVEGQNLFHRYTLKKVLGRGGMGVVWLAQDSRLAREVALKFMPETVRLDLAAADELKHETRRSLKLTHHHIVRIYDFAEDDYTSAVAMEYVNGATLSALRVARPNKVFEAAELENWVRQLCEGLDHAHHWAKIVHRDLKPANLMVTAEGELKITDFGIARSISDSISKLSIRPSTSGTLVYMSPQQALGQKATPLDDVYSLGATLFELLTGKPPFYSGNVQHQLDYVEAPTVTARREELGVKGAAVPVEWEKAIAACLAKDPAERPQGVREVAAALGIPLTSTAVEASSPPAKATTRVLVPRKTTSTGVPQITGRKRRLIGAIAAGLLAVAATAGYYWGVALPAERKAAEISRAAEAREQAIQSAAAEQARLAEEQRQQELAAAKERELAALAEAERQKNEAERLRQERGKAAAGREGTSENVSRASESSRVSRPASSRPSSRDWQNYAPRFGGFPR